MNLERLLFRVFYRLGFTPWDGHALPVRLRALIEGPEALPPGKALDLGCGTGDTSSFLATNGWDVTGVDWVQRAIDRAVAKTVDQGLHVRFVRGDVTKLSSEGVGSGFDLLCDSGCLHGMGDEGRDAYVREVDKVAAPNAFMILVAFPTGGSRPRGIDREEIERRFSPRWELLRSGPDQGASNRSGRALWVHELRRKGAAS